MILKDQRSTSFILCHSSFITSVIPPKPSGCEECWFNLCFNIYQKFSIMFRLGKDGGQATLGIPYYSRASVLNPAHWVDGPLAINQRDCRASSHCGCENGRRSVIRTWLLLLSAVKVPQLFLFQRTTGTFFP